MSFKHNTNSSVAQALEKIAVSKGLVPPQEAPKTKSLDLTVTSSLSENILKLCKGLKYYGFDSYAEELETNFINYKVAEAKETGEDVINSAHPDGSHQLKGVLGDALVETILDKHLKMLKVVEKQPTGKLVSANSIIKAIKNALGQDSSSEDEKIAMILELAYKKIMVVKEKCEKIGVTFRAVNVIAKDQLGGIDDYDKEVLIHAVDSVWEPLREIGDIINKIDQTNFSAKDVVKIHNGGLSRLQHAMQRVVAKTDDNLKSLNKDKSSDQATILNFKKISRINSNVMTLLNEAFWANNEAYKYLTGEKTYAGYVDSESARQKETSQKKQTLLQQTENLLTFIQSSLGNPKLADNADWMRFRLNKLSDLKNKLSSIDPKDYSEGTKKLLESCEQAFNAENSKITSFKAAWSL